MLYRIYRYRNTINDKSYIGQTTVCVNRRARNGKNYQGNVSFNNDIEKYGWNNFEQSILRLCTSQEEADYYEKFFIDKYNTIFPNGYNLQSGGKDGCKYHELTKKHLSEVRQNIHRTEDTKRQISETLKGHEVTEETRKKQSVGNQGKHWFHNETENVFRYECPEGYVPGKLIFKRKIS